MGRAGFNTSSVSALLLPLPSLMDVDYSLQQSVEFNDSISSFAKSYVNVFGDAFGRFLSKKKTVTPFRRIYFLDRSQAYEARCF